MRQRTDSPSAGVTVHAAQLGHPDEGSCPQRSPSRFGHVEAQLLRLKIEVDAANRLLIVTERGAGYWLASDVSTVF
jgi:hypothetical protein